MESETWTPLKLLNWTADYFAGHGVEESRLDAELLLAKVLGIDRIMLYAGFERVVTPAELAAYRAMVKERAAGRPAKYIIGRTEFYSRAFLVDERVLIPRPETELLVEHGLCALRASDTAEFQLVAEIGAGSGAIVVSLAADFPDANYVATDISPAALDVARANARAHGVAAKIEFVSGDLFDPLATTGLEGRVDLIVCNPPYVREDDWAGLPREIREHEPKGALVAGPEGTEFHFRLIDEAHGFLRPGGLLIVEMDNNQKDAIAGRGALHEEYTAPVFHQDYARLWRVFELKRR